MSVAPIIYFLICNSVNISFMTFFKAFVNYHFATCWVFAGIAIFLTRTNSANDNKKQDYFFHGIDFRKLNYK